MAAAGKGGTLADLSSQLAAAVEGAAAYTVAIHARRRIPSSGVVWRDGVIVSASHTVRRDGEVRVSLPGGDAIQATVVGRDATTDLAVLRAERLATSPAPRAESDAGRVGSFVLAVGRPGRNVTASFGIISADLEGWRIASGARIAGLLRLDLSVYDGFSGGALVAPTGAVIGIDNSAFSRGGATALPAAVVDSVVDELLARGHVRRPFIGVGVHPVSFGPTLVERHKLSDDGGLVVVSLAQGEAADSAGLLLGDVLISADGQRLIRPSDLVDALSRVPDGGSIHLAILRGGTWQDISIEPRDRNQEATAA